MEAVYEGKTGNTKEWEDKIKRSKVNVDSKRKGGWDAVTREEWGIEGCHEREGGGGVDVEKSEAEEERKDKGKNERSVGERCRPLPRSLPLHFFRFIFSAISE